MTLSLDAKSGPATPQLIQTTLPMDSARSFTVYLIRHGEAEHNVEEKRAKREAVRSCSERGLGPDDEETKRLAAEARVHVLRDPSFFDAEITQLGRQEAKRARSEMLQCVGEGLPAPREVITSPLQRCLGTVQELFPETDKNDVKVRVEEDLRERLTGRPADNRHNSIKLGEMYPRFDFERLRSLSQSNLLQDLTDSDVSATSLADDQSSVMSRLSSFDSTESSSTIPSSEPFERRSSSQNATIELEDDSCVRKRAFRLFELLAESESDSVAVVTHKGFLRALERGCFGISDSPEFKNCELRVYKIDMIPGRLYMDKIERLR